MKRFAIIMVFLLTFVDVGLCMYFNSEFQKVNTEKDIYQSRAASYQQTAEQATEQAAAAMIELAQANDIADAKEALNAEYIGIFKTTAYCCEKRKHICGTGTGITASGAPVQAGITVASNALPFGTWVYIEGIGIRVVQDTGSEVQANQLDVAVGTHEEALHWEGYGEHMVFVLKVGADGI